MELDIIRETDPQVAELVEKELNRQQNTIELIASENFTSKAVMAACGTVLTNKYAEGKPHKRFYNGCDNIDVIEELAQKEHANYLAQIMPMFNLTVVLKQIWLYFCMR